MNTYANKAECFGRPNYNKFVLEMYLADHLMAKRRLRILDAFCKYGGEDNILDVEMTLGRASEARGRGYEGYEGL